MLYVILNWIYMTLIMVVLGTTVLHILQVWFLRRNKGISLYYALICGYVVCTVYAEIISLFMKVSILANGILIAITIGAGFFCKKHLALVIKNIFRQRKSDIVLESVLVIMVFGFLLSISGTPILLFASGDTGYYHSQAVRWIEEYGCVPGLANLNLRFGFNNANFCLAALFSMYDLLGVSIRGTVTFLVGILLVKAAYELLHIGQHQYYVGDGVRILMLIYTLYRTVQLDGYSTECIAVYLVFAIVLAYCDLQERNEKESFYYGMICLLIIYGATVKLNLVPLGLAVILMGIYLMKEKRIVDIIKYMICSLAIVIPWIVRNVILTGYLLYPFSKLDVFSFDWKVPIETVKRLELITYQFAKAIWYLGVSYEESVNYGFSQWFPKMLHYLFHSFDFEKSCGVMLIITFVALAVSAIVQIVLLIRKIRLGRQWLLLKLCLIAGLIYCILAGPDARYISYVVFTLPAVLIFQYIDKRMLVRLKDHNRAVYQGCLVSLCGGVLIICYLCRGAVLSNLCYLQWHDYKQFLINPGYAYTDANPSQYTSRMPENGCVLREDGYEETNIDGLKIFYQTTTSSYHFVFYDPFPAVYMIDCLDQQYGDRVHARGTDYKDGFWGEFIGY